MPNSLLASYPNMNSLGLENTLPRPPFTINVLLIKCLSVINSDTTEKLADSNKL